MIYAYPPFNFIITMIYLDIDSEAITIPRHTFNADIELTLHMSSNLSDEIVMNVTNTSTNSLYYSFPLADTERFNVGEYTYKLKNDRAVVLESGLITFGDYNRETRSNNTTINKIQYNG